MYSHKEYTQISLRNELGQKKAVMFKGNHQEETIKFEWQQIGHTDNGLYFIQMISNHNNVLKTETIKIMQHYAN